MIRYVSSLSLLLLLGPLASVADEATETRLQRVERRVSHISELVLEVEGLKRTNRQLMGRIEELEHRLRQLEKKQRELYLDLDQRISARAPQNDAAPATEAVRQGERPAQSVGGKPTQPAGVQPAASAEQIRKEYEAAYALLQPSQRSYKKAISAFSSFVARYPQSDLADNALYWLGETYYVTEEGASALKTFDRLLAEYPDSEKVPGALLKKGYILDNMGRKAEARQVLQQLVSDYPDASASRMARTRLQKIK